MNEQILFEKREVYIHEGGFRDETNSNGNSEIIKVGGRLQIVKNKCGTFIRFLPNGCSDSNGTDDWTLVMNNSVMAYNKESKDESDAISIENRTYLNKYKMQFDLSELSSVRRIYQGHSYDIPSIVFMLQDGHTWPNLYFHKGGSKEFLQELKTFYIFKKNPNDPRLWSVQIQNGEKFEQSLYQLSLFNEQREHVMKKFLNEPLQSTLLGFSRVTNMVRDAFRPNETPIGYASNLEQDSSSGIKLTQSNFELAMKKYGNKRKGQNDSGGGDDIMADLLDSLTHENIHSTNNDGYEMVTKVDLGPMPEVVRGLAIDNTMIRFDREGRLMDIDILKAMIFRGGIQHELRKELWKYMLNYYEWDSTAKWRTDRRKQRVDDYYRMKLQWKTISDEQKVKFAMMKERENLIEKDVQRTDRTNVYFEGDSNPNLVTMKDILMTYNMFNFDLGYVQGMSDLLAPIMVVMDNEVDSFWCFAGFMNIVESNFLMDQLNIKVQLSNLKALLEFVDSKYSDYMERNDSANMYFCFRWILILFKREFSFPDIMRLWEVLWTSLPCKNFHLLICIAILMMKKDEIIGNNYGFNEILKFVNDLSLRIDLEKTLEYAEGLYLQIKNFKNLPTNICEILDFPIADKGKDEELDGLEETLVNLNLNRDRENKTSIGLSKIPTPIDDPQISPSNDSLNRSKISSNNMIGLASSINGIVATTGLINNSPMPQSSSTQFSFKNGDDSIEILN